MNKNQKNSIDLMRISFFIHKCIKQTVKSKLKKPNMVTQGKISIWNDLPSDLIKINNKIKLDMFHPIVERYTLKQIARYKIIENYKFFIKLENNKLYYYFIIL